MRAVAPAQSSGAICIWAPEPPVICRDSIDAERSREIQIELRACRHRRELFALKLSLPFTTGRHADAQSLLWRFTHGAAVQWPGAQNRLSTGQAAALASKPPASECRVEKTPTGLWPPIVAHRRNCFFPFPRPLLNLNSRRHSLSRHRSKPTNQRTASSLDYDVNFRSLVIATGRLPFYDNFFFPPFEFAPHCMSLSWLFACVFFS